MGRRPDGRSRPHHWSSEVGKLTSQIVPTWAPPSDRPATDAGWASCRPTDVEGAVDVVGEGQVQQRPAVALPAGGRRPPRPAGGPRARAVAAIDDSGSGSYTGGSPSGNIISNRLISRPLVTDPLGVGAPSARRASGERRRGAGGRPARASAGRASSFHAGASMNGLSVASKPRRMPMARAATWARIVTPALLEASMRSSRSCHSSGFERALGDGDGDRPARSGGHRVEDLELAVEVDEVADDLQHALCRSSPAPRRCRSARRPRRSASGSARPCCCGGSACATS